MKENNENEKFVPSYNKSSDPSTTSNVKSKKKNKKVKSKISVIILLIVILGVIGAIVFGIFKFVKNNVNETNVNYLQNMKDYGFDIMYDNKTAEPSETVTKSEAIKMVVTSMTNESDIKKLVDIGNYIPDFEDSMTEEQIEEKLEYKNKLWVDYAVEMGIVEENQITKDNANDNLTLLDVLVYFANAKVKILNQTLDTEVKPDIKNYDSYKVPEQLALSDMIYNQMATADSGKLKATLLKEHLNKLIIEMVLKYNTITFEGEKININKEKEPSNVKEYPYTLASIDKSIYEIANYKVNDEYKTPREIYVKTKGYYDDINEIVTEYMNLILNINYETLKDEEFTENLLDLTFHYEDEEDIKAYINHVKNNKIKLSGSAKVQFPAIYFDGEKYRVRTKVDYKIESANVKENLIYGDLQSKETVKYDKEQDSFIIDIPFNQTIIDKFMYIEARAFNNIIAGAVKSDKDSLKVKEQKQEKEEMIEVDEEESEDIEDIIEGDKIDEGSTESEEDEDIIEEDQETLEDAADGDYYEDEEEFIMTEEGDELVITTP